MARALFAAHATCVQVGHSSPCSVISINKSTRADRKPIVSSERRIGEKYNSAWIAMEQHLMHIMRLVHFVHDLLVSQYSGFSPSR